MIDYRNPYTPGAGMKPKYLAGRAHLLEDAQMRMEAISTGYQSRSIMYYGLRGVGKTVLLNEIELMADTRDVLCCHIEVKESSNFIASLAIACKGFIRELSLKQTIKDSLDKVMQVLRAFNATWNPEDKTFTLSVGDIAREDAMLGSGDLPSDVTELLVSLGRAAQKADSSICFCIDEIQYAKKAELEALITAIHRLNQLNLPIIFYCAGLPKILKEVGDIKSYSERLFEFVAVGSLRPEDATEAIVVPAESLGVEYTQEAIDLILDLTDGYPYFIQEMCNTIWGNHDTKIIDAAAVNGNVAQTNERLDTGFFRVRYDRCTAGEREFIIAMAKVGHLPCTTSCVAAIMGRDTSSIGPIRAKLIHKGLIYATRHGEIDFTVPQFDVFINRICSK